MIFGDPATFAISYIPDHISGKYVFAYCHLILGGEFIGLERETCLLATWRSRLASILDRIVNEDMSDTLFNNLTDREILELILKSNQLTEEYDPAYSYLPVWSSAKWVLHTVFLDETIDAYFIVVLEQEGRLKFIWEKWENREQPSSVFVEREMFIKAANEYLAYVK